MTKIRHVVEVMDRIAPPFLAEQWDNIGLQVGHKGWPVRKIWVALDPTVGLVEKAAEQKVDLVITHHPLLFRPLSAIELEAPTGRMIDIALAEKIGIFSAHTNLDSAEGGVNDLLAERLGVVRTRILQPVKSKLYRLVTYVPVDHEERVAEAMFASGAGRSRKYSDISFRTRGVGTYKPCATAEPFSGRIGEMSRESECRVEVLVAGQFLPRVIESLLASHPYEEVVYDIYTISNDAPNEGLGRIGELEEALSLESFASRVKDALDLKFVKIAGSMDQMVKRVAVCGGSAKGLFETFLATDAQVFIGGDFGYHEGRSVEDTGRVIIDVGHFASEYVVVNRLCESLSELLKEAGHDVDVAVYKDETDSFRFY